jgi:hypothetical protein
LKEREYEKCESDPLFSKIPVNSANRKVSDIKKLPTGKVGNADKNMKNLWVR